MNPSTYKLAQHSPPLLPTFVVQLLGVYQFIQKQFWQLFELIIFCPFAHLML